MEAAAFSSAAVAGGGGRRMKGVLLVAAALLAVVVAGTIVDDLERLGELYRQQLLSTDQYERAKERLLGNHVALQGHQQVVPEKRILSSTDPLAGVSLHLKASGAKLALGPDADTTLYRAGEAHVKTDGTLEAAKLVVNGVDVAEALAVLRGNMTTLSAAVGSGTAAGGGSSSDPVGTVSDGLVFYSNMETYFQSDMIMDLSGNGRHGTVYNHARQEEHFALHFIVE